MVHDLKEAISGAGAQNVSVNRLVVGSVPSRGNSFLRSGVEAKARR